MKIAIIGTARSSAEEALEYLKNPEWTCYILAWQIPEGLPHDPERIVAFETHDRDTFQEEVTYYDAPEYVKWRRETKIPLIMQKKHKQYQSSVAFPFKEVRKYFKFGKGAIGTKKDPDYLASSFGYMLTYAIMQEPTHLAILGIDVYQPDEYPEQRPNAQLFIGWAMGKGIEVYIPEQSSLCKCNFVYGRNTIKKEGHITKPILDERAQHYGALAQDSEIKMTTTRGHREELGALASMYAAGHYEIAINGKGPVVRVNVEDLADFEKGKEYEFLDFVGKRMDFYALQEDKLRIKMIDAKGRQGEAASLSDCLTFAEMGGIIPSKANKQPSED